MTSVLRRVGQLTATAMTRSLPMTTTCCALLMCSSASAQSGSAPEYRFRALPMPPGATNAQPFPHMTEGGRITVNYDIGAYVHEPDGSFRPLSGGQSVQYINDRGFAAGGSLSHDPVVWLPGGQRIDLPVPAGLDNGFVMGVTAHGDAVGRVMNNQGFMAAVLWKRGLPPTTFPQLAGTWSNFFKMGENGHAVGDHVITFGQSRGIYFDGTTITHVDFALGNTLLECVNDSGQAAGRANSTVPAFPGYVGQQAFVYDHTTGQKTGLGFLGQWGYYTQPSDINNHEEVVGFSIRQPPNGNVLSAGFLWKDGQMYNLNLITEGIPAQVKIINGQQIDDQGRILCEYYVSNPNTERYKALLMPKD